MQAQQPHSSNLSFVSSMAPHVYDQVSSRSMSQQRGREKKGQLSARQGKGQVCVSKAKCSPSMSGTSIFVHYVLSNTKDASLRLHCWGCMGWHDWGYRDCGLRSA